MLEDVDELMPAKPWWPLEETDIAAVHSVFDAQKFSLLLSRDEEIEVLRSLSRWNPSGGVYVNSPTEILAEGKGFQKRQRPTEVNTVLALKGGDSRFEIPTATNQESEVRDDDFDAAQGPGRPGQAAVVRRERYRCEFLSCV